MLQFSDRAEQIVVFRTEPSEKGQRYVKLGAISKDTLRVPEKLKAGLGDGELQEVESAIAMFRAATEAEIRATVLRFPQTVREVREYVTSSVSGNELERKMITGAMIDALRSMRRKEKAKVGNDDNASKG